MPTLYNLGLRVTLTVAKSGHAQRQQVVQIDDRQGQHKDHPLRCQSQAPTAHICSFLAWSSRRFCGLELIRASQEPCLRRLVYDRVFVGYGSSNVFAVTKPSSSLAMREHGISRAHTNGATGGCSKPTRLGSHTDTDTYISEDLRASVRADGKFGGLLMPASFTPDASPVIWATLHKFRKRGDM